MQAPNPVRTALEADEVTLGAKAGTYAPAVVEIYGRLGVDWVWVDFEHAGPTPWSSPILDDLVRAAEVGGTELLVRVPSADPAMIRKVLDTGVRNVIVPRIGSAAELRRAVEATRFRFDGAVGDRGLGDWRASDYGTADHARFVRSADEQVLLGGLIEKHEAVENLESILDVPELGFVWIGVNDLCVQYGHPGDPDHPAVADARRTIERQTRDAGLPLAGVANDPEAAREAIDRGYRMLRIGGELEAVEATIGRRLDRLAPALE